MASILQNTHKLVILSIVGITNMTIATKFTTVLGQALSLAHFAYILSGLNMKGKNAGEEVNNIICDHLYSLSFLKIIHLV